MILSFSLWDFYSDCTRSKEAINLFFDSLNASPSQKKTHKKVFSNIPTNDRIAILQFYRELRLRSFDGWHDRDSFLVEKIRNRDIAKSGMELICINCKNTVNST